MTKPVIIFPDAVEVAVNYLRPLVSAPVFSRVPNPRPAAFVRFQRLGGTKRSIILDRPRLDVECWSDSEEGAEALMKVARAHMHAIGGKRGGTTVYDVAEVSGPMWLPDSESGQPRYSFAVEFSTRGTRLETA